MQRCMILRGSRAARWCLASSGCYSTFQEQIPNPRFRPRDPEVREEIEGILDVLAFAKPAQQKQDGRSGLSAAERQQQSKPTKANRLKNETEAPIPEDDDCGRPYVPQSPPEPANFFVPRVDRNFPKKNEDFPLIRKRYAAPSPHLHGEAHISSVVPSLQDSSQAAKDASRGPPDDLTIDEQIQKQDFDSISGQTVELRPLRSTGEDNRKIARSSSPSSLPKNKELGRVQRYLRTPHNMHSPYAAVKKRYNIPTVDNLGRPSTPSFSSQRTDASLYRYVEMEGQSADLRRQLELATKKKGATEGSQAAKIAGGETGIINTTKPSTLVRHLPISPLMDPAYLEARARHTARKSDPTKGSEGSLQARLAKNPYALALATPVRECRLTGALLPKYFLQGFNLMEHPETRQAWWTATDMAIESKVLKAITTNETKKNMAGNDEEASGNDPEHSHPIVGEDADVDVHDTAHENATKRKIGANAYILFSKLLIEDMNDRSTRSRRRAPPHLEFISQRIKRLRVAFKVASEAGWRKDMPDFILELWRRRIKGNLIYLLGLRKGYVVPCNDWQDALEKKCVGAFLWTGDTGQASSPPHEWATLDVPYGERGLHQTKKIPVYNLRALLGEKHLGEMGKNGKADFWNKEILALKDKNATLALRMKLWKMQGYVASFGWAGASRSSKARKGVPEQEELELEDGDGEMEDISEDGPNEKDS